MTTEPSCPYCGKAASEIESFAFEAGLVGMTPAKFAREDGTYNPETNHFVDDECYIRIGMPSSATGWRAP